MSNAFFAWLYKFSLSGDAESGTIDVEIIGPYSSFLFARLGFFLPARLGQTRASMEEKA
jgi:hypothetical protein